ncbi:metal transporter [Vibrio sp. 10N.286.49.B3]|uniref:cation diffusion facilitator family transporter n=1 Tax=Vibrio sp. 10N.286.49.B3 TaxID=1880855 RepID=UPI000C83338B|nr:cation diffusion facilitator family transporter [Vibrio sp. 10N.286.49.B3]PMH44462.1 metal transporter [Vibrio sp. 10N.286.49.B3]
MSFQTAETVRKVTWVGSIANMLLAIMKIVVGKLTNSQALIADGVHSFSDLITDAAILIGSRYWSAPADDNHPYGHGRYETLTNIFIGIVLLMVGFGLAWDSLHALNNEPETIVGSWALVAALISIVIKELLYRWTAKQADIINSRVLFANAWHHRSDALSSVPVALSVIIGFVYPEILYVDQIASLFVTAMIVKASVEILWPAIREITETQADEELHRKIQRYALEHHEIKEVHAIRNRRLGSGILLDFHLLVEPSMSVEQAHDISKMFKQLLIENHSELYDIIIHIEPYHPKH